MVRAAAGRRLRDAWDAWPDPAALVGNFRIVATHAPNYELGERCPTLIMPPV